MVFGAFVHGGLIGIDGHDTRAQAAHPPGPEDPGDPRLRAELMKRLVSLSESLNRPSSVAGVASAIGHAALALSGAQRVAVYLRSPSGIITCPWSQGISPAYTAQIVTPKGANPWTHLARHPELTCMDLPKGRRDQGPEPTLIGNVATDLPPGNDVRRRAGREGFRALGAWPLMHEGRVTASVACYFDAPHTWSPPEREAMQAFSWQAAAALETGRSSEAQGQRTAELEALYDLSSRLRSAHTPEELYPILVDRAVRLGRADHGALAILTPDGQTLTQVHATGAAAETPASTIPVAGPAVRVIKDGTPYVTDDVAEEVRRGEWKPVPAAYASLGPLAVVALRDEREIIGTMTVGRARSEQKEPFVEAELRLLKAIAEMGGTAIHRSRLYQDLEESYIEMVLTLARAIDARDAYTGGHSERLAGLAEAAARMLGCRDEEIQHIRWGALLHDIGKIAVPDAILRKPARLTDEEWAVMRRHPETGEEILRPVERMHAVAKILRHHHEKWDGTGYPDRLQEQMIPLGARIMAVVDAYSAITDERPYKPARTHEDAVAELRRAAGTQFDPRVVDAFCRAVERAREKETAG